MIGFCKTSVPQRYLDALEQVKDDDGLVKEFGIKQCTEMCQELIENGI